MSEIRLEPLSAAHADAVRPMFDDQDSLRFTRIPEPPPPGFFEQWLGSYAEGRAAGTREGFAVVDGGGELVGLALAPHIARAEGEAELGYVVHPAARGRGVATRALTRLTEWALGELGLERVELRISTANEASKRVAERCGYVREGVLRSTYVKPGRREDVEVWSRLATDPPPPNERRDTLP
jgi:RimJ/RimL family protein N-acetyltransferase